MIQRRWEGDTTFRGAYLQWAMGWVNSAHRPCEVVHNLNHPVSGEKMPHVVARIPSYGEERIFAKEQALIDLVRAELEQNRSCVIYLRQTSTRDIQPRIEALIRRHVPQARTFILKNTVEAERREAVIEAEVAKGTNVVISNPELVKTGLDLVFAPTLIFYEITFNLGTMMQAAGRSYRLNQTHTHCKTYYLFAQNTMEQTAVQLMSRKQRAAKLLTGDIGLTGLDALTEGESGFEQALLDAIGRDEALLDPSELFKKSEASGEIDREDAAYWNVEQVEPEQADPVLAAAVELGATITVEEAALPLSPNTLDDYLDSVVLVVGKTWERLKPELIALIQENPARLCDWLRDNKVVFPGCETEVAAKLVAFAEPVSAEVIQPAPVAVSPKPSKRTISKPRKRDLLAAPEDLPMPPPKLMRREALDETAPLQLALF